MSIATGQFSVRWVDQVQQKERHFVGGRDFRLDLGILVRRLGLQLSRRMSDLMRIASSVYFVDRLVLRNRKGGPDNWPRQIDCAVEVQDARFWADPQIVALAEGAVNFASGDRWRFSFPQDSAEPIPVQQSLFETASWFAQPPIVTPYSGGLDSAAGLALRLTNGMSRPILPVIVRHRLDISRNASRQLSLLEKAFRVSLMPAAVHFSMRAPKHLVGFEERTQRSRAFLFMSTAGIAAGAAGSRDVEIYESGIGALNVPLLAGMGGSQATRGTHPVFLKTMAQLLTAVIGRDINITLPFDSYTKGEVARGLQNGLLQSVAESTVSCARYPIRHNKGRGWLSCGVCPACIFRRVALHSANIDDPSNQYEYDILGGDSCPLNRKHLHYLNAYLAQIDSFSELDQNKLPWLIRRHLRRTGIQYSDSFFIDLFSRYRREWQHFLRHARRKGCSWANRVEIQDQAI